MILFSNFHVPPACPPLFHFADSAPASGFQLPLLAIWERGGYAQGMSSMRVAAVQLTSTPDKDRNLHVAGGLIDAAAAAGARLVVLPEMFNVLGDDGVMRQGAEPLDGPTLRWAGDSARKHRLWLVAGSIMERIPGSAKQHNTCCLFDPTGVIRAVYRKIHLFDNDVPGAAFRESDRVMPGDEIVSTTVDETTLGFGICYDLRFPEIFRILALRGARMVALPAAFTERTGRDHWEALLRARAIENQVFMIAADQMGGSTPGLRWFGRSMIVNPWGNILAQAPDCESQIVCDLDFAGQDAIRQQLPSLANRRPAAYRWPQD